MNILVLNGSPAGKNSITLQTVEFIKSRRGGHNFEVLHVGQKIRSMEKDFSPCASSLRKADLIIFCYPVYTFLVPAQLHRFIELIKEKGIDLSGKCATQLSTSKHFYDITAHRFIEDNCADLGLKYIKGLSADMDDLLNEKGQKQALDFFDYTVWSIENDCFEVPKVFKTETNLRTASPAQPAEKMPKGRVVVVADFSADEEGRLKALTDRFVNRFTLKTDIVDISQFPFSGGCLGCFNCASSGKCIYKDGFDDYLRQNIQSCDAIVYAFKIKDHSMGGIFKLYDDRQFCNGHRTVTMGKPVAYLIDGDLDRETNVRTLLESRASVGGNFLAGIASTGGDPDGETDAMAKRLAYAVESGYQPPADFYGVGGMKIFRDLIYRMQGLMRADHKFYKAHGFYKDYPQKHKGQIAAMYLVGAMMNNKKLSKKIGSKMTEGMLMPYTAAMKKAEKRDKK